VNPDQLRALMTQRNVLFVASQLDITQDVIAAMDAKYTKK
jgi:Skp family chaperone for outer membrane proteins